MSESMDRDSSKEIYETTATPLSTATPSVAVLQSRVAADRKVNVGDLAKLVSYPSLAFPGFDPQPNLDCAGYVLKMVQAAGFSDAHLIEVGPGFPAIWAEHHVSPDLPTVLLYAHYDVQPAPFEEQEWESDPWTLTEKDDGRLYGRGAADDKSGIIQHLAALRILGGLEAIDTVNIKLIIEGEEEAFGHLDTYVPTDPERFSADVFLIADSGNLRVGEPVIETTLRGVVSLDVEVATMAHAVHSGLFGGPAPDALLALIKLLSTLYNEAGDTVIEGVKGGEWGGAQYDEELFKSQIGLLDGVELRGSASLASLLWAKPSATVLGITPNIKDSSNIIIPKASARISMRIPAGNVPQEALEALKAHLVSHAPNGAHVSFSHEQTSPPFSMPEDSPRMRLALQALTDSFGVEATTIGCGASIPLVSELQGVAPEATVIMFGPEDSELSRIHGGNESVDPAEIDRCAVAEALFIARLV